MAGSGAAADPVERGRLAAERPRLLWLMLLRVGLITILLGATLGLNYENFDAASPRFLLGLIAFTYLATIVWAVWYRLGRAVPVLARLQLGVDLLVWGSLAYATGGVSSGFTFLFDLWVIVAAVVLGGRAAFHVAAASAVVLLGLTGLMGLGALLPLSDQLVEPVGLEETLYFIGVNIVALCLVATLVSSLVSRLERTGRGLEDERERRADLSALHSDIIRSLPVGLATTDKDGRIIAVNRTGRGLLQVDDRDLEGRPLESSLPEFGSVIRSGADGGRGLGSLRTANGRLVPVDYSVTPLLFADGSQRGWIAIFNDLSKLRQLEADLERSRKLAALGELAASLAHEIRNPLSAVSGSFQMLSGRAVLDEEERSLGEIIFRELQRMERLVGDVLDYARPRDPVRRATDLGRVTEETIRAFTLGKDGEGHEIAFHVEGNPVAVADEGQVRQVVWNLLRNASQAAGDDGALRVAVAGGADRVAIEVEDSGAGIDPEVADQVFDPFYSTRELGLGIGLALCQRVAAAHGGTIGVSAGELGGALLVFTVPRGIGAEVEAAPDDEPEAP